MAAKPDFESNNIVKESEPSHITTENGVPQLNAWLEKVFRKYLSSNTLELLKFNLSEEIPRASLERTTCLFELFVLIKEFYGGNETQALSRLVYILDLVGHKRFGKKAVRLMSEFQLQKPPKYDPSQDPRSVQLRHCLVEISSRLTDNEEYRIRSYCARIFQINVASLSINSITALMDLLLGEKKITEENQLDLVHALTTIGADKCINYVIKYRERNGLLTQEYKALKNPDSKSTYSSSKTFSSYRSIQVDSSEESYATSDVDDVARRSRKRTDEWIEATECMHMETEDEIQSLLNHQNGHSMCCKLWMVVKITILAVLAVLLLVGIGGSAYGTANAISHQYSHQSQLVYGNSRVPLIYDLLPYYLSSVDIIQINKTSLHVIDLFLVDTPCSQLNITKTTSQTSRVDEPYIENITGWYLFPGTTLEYYICAVTSVSRSEYEVIVEAYLMLDNLSAALDQIITKRRYINGEKIAENFACYENNSDQCPCWSVSYQVKRPSYYSLWFTINNPQLFPHMKFNYSRSIMSFTYSTPSSYEHILHQCQLTDFEAHCNFLFNDSSIHYPWNMNKEMCILADIHGNPPQELAEKKEFSEVKIYFTGYSTNWLVVSAAVLGVLVLMLIVVGGAKVWACHNVRKKRKSKKVYL